jgi:hypothetical protein
MRNPNNQIISQKNIRSPVGVGKRVGHQGKMTARSNTFDWMSEQKKRSEEFSFDENSLKDQMIALKTCCGSTGQKGKKISLSTGFEPVRAEHNRFQVYHLNHSVTKARHLMVLHLLKKSKTATLNFNFIAKLDS